jgi:hypothetical protein
VIIAPGEQRVSGIGVKQARMWRRLLSCAVAYAFALQIVLLSFVAPAIAAAPADQDVLAAGLCLHDQSTPVSPGNNSGGDEHCKFCTAGGHQVFAAPTPAHHAIVRVAEAAAPPATDPLALSPRAHTAAQPRGPPLSA